jgi:VWFA-related protein
VGAQQTEPAPIAGAKLRVTVRAVLVPVVVRDANGREVGNLRKEDFEIFDNHKAQSISGFSIQKRAAAEGNKTIPEPAAPGESPARQPSATAQPRYIVFLFDDLHLGASDLTQAQKVASKMIGGSLNDSDLGLVISFSGANSGFTRDRTKLQETVAKLRTQELYRHAGRECPDVDYDQGHLIVNQHNQQAFDLAVQEALGCGHINLQSVAEGMATTAARRAVNIGDQDVRVTLGFLTNLVRKMGTLAGERTLILVSPGFLTMTPEALAEKSQVLDTAAESNVTISALDARGLYTTELSASEHGGNTIQGMQTGQHAQNHHNTMKQSEDILAELAEGTGGTYFHNSNDLEGGFLRLAGAPEVVYLLELSVDKVKQDGTYHRLKVKVGRDGLKLQARRGYFAPKKENK